MVQLSFLLFPAVFLSTVNGYVASPRSDLNTLDDYTTLKECAGTYHVLGKCRDLRPKDSLSKRAILLNILDTDDDIEDGQGNKLSEADAAAQFREDAAGAGELIRAALASLQDQTFSAANSMAFQVFFGTTRPDLVQRITENFQRMANPNFQWSVTLNSGDARNPDGTQVEAFTQLEPHRTGNFFRAFWQLPRFSSIVPAPSGHGTGGIHSLMSRAGTILHEFGHAVLRDANNAIQTTGLSGDPEVYGPFDCEQLAQNNAERASRNMDNYLFYVYAIYYGYFSSQVTYTLPPPPPVPGSSRPRRPLGPRPIQSQSVDPFARQQPPSGAAHWWSLVHNERSWL